MAIPFSVPGHSSKQKRDRFGNLHYSEQIAEVQAYMFKPTVACLKFPLGFPMDRAFYIGKGLAVTTVLRH